MSEQPNIAELRDQIQALDRLLAEGQAGNTGYFTWHEAYKSRCRKVVKAMGNPEWDAAPDLLGACGNMAALLADFTEALDGGTLTKQSVHLGTRKRYRTLARDFAEAGEAAIAKASPSVVG